MRAIPEAESSPSTARLATVARQAPGQVAVVALALIGLGISIYLTSVHYARVPLICSTTGLIDCASVIRSRFGVVPGTSVPITIPGLLWFLVSGGLALATLRSLWRGVNEAPWLRRAQVIWGGLGLLSVFYLVFAELVVLHRICAWCTGVHVAVVATLLLAVNRLTAPPTFSAPAKRAVIPTSSAGATRAAQSAHPASGATRSPSARTSGTAARRKR